AAVECSSIEVPVIRLHHPTDRVLTIGTVGLATKFVKRREISRRRDFEDGAATTVASVAAAAVGGAVKVSVGALNQTGRRVRAVGTVRLSTEAVQHGQLARRSDFENGAFVVQAAAIRRAVEVAVSALHHSARTEAIGTVKAGQRSEEGVLCRQIAHCGGRKE